MAANRRAPISASVARHSVPLAPGRPKVELVPHDRTWAAQAGAEAARIAGAIGETLIRIDHVGSTAIPGIAAKPTIDLMPVVANLAETALARVAIVRVVHRGFEKLRSPSRAQPPAMAGTMLISVPLESFVSRPSRKRTSSSPT